MYDEYYSWNPKRNTGMKLSWFYTEPEGLQPEYNYLESNKHFLLMANVIHQVAGAEEDLRKLVNDMIIEKKGKCSTGQVSEENSKLLSAKYGNITTEAIYKNEITEETLESTARLYFGVIFCPDSDQGTEEFYESLLEKFPIETIVKTLARILSVANEKKLTEHYQTAMDIFDKISTMLNFQSRDIVRMTTPASELELYPDLQSSENSHGNDGNVLTR